jgi:hypothetical protein
MQLRTRSVDLFHTLDVPGYGLGEAVFQSGYLLNERQVTLVSPNRSTPTIRRRATIEYLIISRRTEVLALLPHLLLLLVLVQRGECAWGSKQHFHRPISSNTSMLSTVYLINRSQCMITALHQPFSEKKVSVCIHFTNALSQFK